MSLGFGSSQIHGGQKELLYALFGSKEDKRKAGLQHIMLEHERQLSQRCIERDEVVELVKGATMIGR